MKNHPANAKIISLVSFLLMLALLLCMTSACAQDKPDEKESTTAEIPVATTSEDTGNYDANGFLKDSLPEQTNLGVDIVMLYWSDVENVEFEVEDASVGMVEESIYRRNKKVESRMGVNIDF